MSKLRSPAKAEARLARRQASHGKVAPERKAPGSLNPHKAAAKGLGKRRKTR